MSKYFDRRSFLLVAAAVPLALARAAQAAPGHRTAEAMDHLSQLEAAAGGRIGVFALDTANHATLRYRAGEPFPLCSTSKFMLVGAVLRQSEHEDELLEKRISYTQSDLLSYSPITKEHLRAGMTVADLCAAAIRYSDNTAANLLLKLVGGPASVTAFASSLHDRHFRLDRWEPELNTCLPGDLRDTSTPEAMGLSLKQLAIDHALKAEQRGLLVGWLRGSTTGAERIRAGVPKDWQVGDKTGTGDYGTGSDIAVLWPPHRAPIVAAIYTTQRVKEAKARNEIIAAAAQVIVRWSD